MRISFLLLFCSLLFCSCAVQRYYIVRHAEKATAEPNMSSDVPLTAAGQQRAAHLAELLKEVKLAQVYSTNTLRTRSTAAPAATAAGLSITIYGPRPDSLFIRQLQALKGNVLVVGHSNTVDDIVNGLMQQQLMQDLPDSTYGRLYIITRKGGRMKFTERGF